MNLRRAFTLGAVAWLVALVGILVLVHPVEAQALFKSIQSSYWAKGGVFRAGDSNTAGSFEAYDGDNHKYTIEFPATGGNRSFKWPTDIPATGDVPVIQGDGGTLWEPQSGGASTAASFWTKVVEGGLSNEFAMGALGTGLVKNHTTTGEPTIATPGSDYYAPGSIDVALADGGTANSLSDPGGHRVAGWDDTDNLFKFFTIGSGLSYDDSTDTLSASSAGVTAVYVGIAQGIVANNNTQQHIDPSLASGSKTISAGTLVPGKTYRIMFKGSIQGDAAASGDLVNFYILLGTTAIAQTQTGGLPQIASKEYVFNGEATFTCRTIGLTGTVFCMGEINCDVTPTPALSGYYPLYGGAGGLGGGTGSGGTVDTTSNQTVFVDCTMSNARTNNKIKIDVYGIEKLN